MTAANNEALGGTRTGNVNVTYDATSNMTGLGVVRRGTCLGSTAGCTQQYAYDWDEVGRLVRARRWDSTATAVDLNVIPAGTPAAELRYRYDANDNRVIKRAYVSEASQLHTLYVFDSLDIRRTTFSGGAYTINESTQVPYLNAHGMKLARLHYEPVTRAVPQVSGLSSSNPGWFGTVGSTLHVMLRLTDHLGSTATVIDKASGELVEKASFQAYGARESDYRASRWAGFRDDYGFTGKEEDVEVGLAYFGKRFLNAQLGRWVSPDPLAVHAPGKADLNLYAYVSGRALRSVDPMGLTIEDIIARTSINTIVGRLRDVGGPSHVVAFARDNSHVNSWHASNAVADFFERTFSKDGGGVLGLYNPMTNQLSMRHERLQQLAASFPVPGKPGPVLSPTDLGVLFHESTHAYLNLAKGQDVKDFISNGVAYYKSKGVGWDADRVFDEAASGYVGHRAGEWGAAFARLNNILNRADGKSLTNRQALRLESELNDLRKDYNSAMSERVFGYGYGGTNKTSVPISDDMKKFLDSTVLEGRISDNFDTQFASQVGDLNKRIEAGKNASQ
jgi:RHS repeat-associated protein